ncbi:hypothetical protein EZV62_001115 [Acer yangbiense]|uniref:Chalcone synthase n=1 Tax=Acer yangbiense TaxID=1000413 RepID=A0A5C7IVH9_9ROSI|nr:hypothetical protein EZV62_001115 [Acer yangbiense]
MVSVEEFRRSQCVEGPATIMAIGKANPPNSVDQSTYPDYYFRVTNSEHKTDLKKKFKRICKEAAMKAIKQWGQSKSKITHLIFITSAGIDMPRADYQLAKIMGLNHSVKCVIRRSRWSRRPGALFSDGAAAMIVGFDPIPGVEKPLYEIFSAGQNIVLGSDRAIRGPLREIGVITHLHKDNSVFWIAHPGEPAIMDQVEATLGLNPEKLRASRNVLAEYDNMHSACVLFILDEMRNKSAKDGLETTGEGLEWGVLFGFGPGLTIETVVLRSFAAN